MYDARLHRPVMNDVAAVAQASAMQRLRKTNKTTPKLFLLLTTP